jgi:hypothetical protein
MFRSILLFPKSYPIRIRSPSFQHWQNTCPVRGDIQNVKQFFPPLVISVSPAFRLLHSVVLCLVSNGGAGHHQD